jgi:hypothetical protein
MTNDEISILDPRCKVSQILSLNIELVQSVRTDSIDPSSARLPIWIDVPQLRDSFRVSRDWRDLIARLAGP